jgi:hypothetical protein
VSNHADSKAQPAPTGDGDPVLVEVISDLVTRRGHGIKKYGTELRACNGRDGLADAYQESLDLSMYLKQELMTRDRIVTGAVVVGSLFTPRELRLLQVGVDRWRSDLGAASTLTISPGATRGELEVLLDKVTRFAQS